MQKLFMAIGLLLASSGRQPGTGHDHLWPTTTPTQSFSNARPVELGVKFRSDVNGSITGIRFYKGPADTSVHTGSLWSSSGPIVTPLARSPMKPRPVGSSSISPRRWRSPPIRPTPRRITPAVRSLPTFNYFQNQGVDNPPLHALQNGVDGANGVYALWSLAECFRTRPTRRVIIGWTWSSPFARAGLWTTAMARSRITRLD